MELALYLTQIESGSPKKNLWVLSIHTKGGLCLISIDLGC
jgi:hypothetical protein